MPLELSGRSHTIWPLALAAVLVVGSLNGGWGDEANVDAVARAMLTWNLVEEPTLDLTYHLEQQPG